MATGDRDALPAQRGRDISLVLLAVGAGAADAISITVIGVFTAAVTANIVLLGLAIGETDVHTATRAAVAFGAFSVGVLGGSFTLRGARRAGAPPPRLAPVLAGIAAAQGAFLAIWLASDGNPDGVALSALAGASGLAMGGQTAAARSWHASGVTTTYVSGTLTLLLTELALERGALADRLRLGAVIVAVVAGAAIGAVMLKHAREPVAIVPLAMTLLVALGGGALARGSGRRDP